MECVEFQWVTKTGVFSPKASALAPELHPDQLSKILMKIGIVLIIFYSYLNQDQHTPKN